MPAFYLKYQDQLAKFLGEFAEVQTNFAPLPTDLPLVAGSLGGQILAATHAVNFQTLFDNFNNLTAGFQWDPSAAGSYSVARALELLDGTRTSGECKIMAAALLGLWVFPAPFGLGQARTLPKATLYTFENYDNAEGFISHHPVNGVRALRPNIMHPFGTPADLHARQPLYQWGDHKVIFYNGMLWDPSYGDIWHHEGEMVAFEFTGVPHATDRDAYQVRVVTPNPARGWMPAQIMYMRMDVFGGGWKGPYRDIV